MDDSSKTGDVRHIDRINLRLTSGTFEAIDEARAARPGHVSRNTWISEAVQEKLAREEQQASSAPEPGRRHA
jgi:metal-responsive CopG/Arc/MetJ family transcriptional regulator